MKAVLRCLVALLFTYEAASLHAQEQPGEVLWKFEGDPINSFCLASEGNIFFRAGKNNIYLISKNGETI